MLTYHQIETMYNEGIEIIFDNNPAPATLTKEGIKIHKGDYDPSSLEAIIYTREIRSKKDRDITILHELIHANNDIKGSRYYSSISEEERYAEREAIKTYLKRKMILKYIKELWAIED